MIAISASLQALFVSVLLSYQAEAVFQLRSASEALSHKHGLQQSESGELHGEEVIDATTANRKMMKALDIDWWFLARSTAISVLITVTLVVGICVCIKFGEEKKAEHWGQWAGGQDSSEDPKWQKIEEKMQSMDATGFVEATDYQQILKNMAQKVGRDRGIENSKSGALRSFFGKAFRLNDMNSTAGAVLETMPAKEAVHWLQMKPQAFGPM